MRDSRRSVSGSGSGFRSAQSRTLTIYFCIRTEVPVVRNVSSRSEEMRRICGNRALKMRRRRSLRSILNCVKCLV